MCLRGWYLVPMYIGACMVIIPSEAQGVTQLVKGGTFTMSCFNTPFKDNMYVDLMLSSSGQERTVAKYQASQQEVSILETSYEGRLSFTMEGDAVISNIRIDDEGTYKCTERSFPDADKVKEAELQVLVRPEITAGLLNSPLQAGNSVTEAAVCTASNARPEAEVSWSSDRHLAFNQTTSSTPGSSSSLTHTTATLTVVPTKYFDGHRFICTIKHPSFANGENATMVILVVQYAPTRLVIEVINQNTKLRCKAEGNPLPEIRWTMPPGNTPPNPTRGESVIPIISPESAARQNDTYICTADNGIPPVTSCNITTAEAVTYVEVIGQSNTGVVVGIVVGCIVLLAIIGALVYWFCIRKMRKKDTGPYPQKRSVRQTQDDGWSRSSGRPIIQHANEDLNRSPPPEPKQPPPDDEEEEEQSNSSHSDAEEYTEGDDVELNSPANGVDDDDAPTAGIISKNSVNFQHRRKRPSTSPHSRSQKRNQPEAPPESAQADPQYEVPPTEYYDDEYDEHGRLLHGHEEEEVDDRFYDRPEDRYPGYRPQPQYDDPPMDEQLPPYSDRLQYASIDHSYNPSKPRTRPPYQEPVEYAEIRSHGQIV